MNIWAHRGLSRLYPENTLSAFEAACAYDITGVELDVHLTADGEPVVIHDETVDRTTDGTGAVRDLTLEEIRALRIPAGLGTEHAGRFEHIPTLREVLALCGPYCRDFGMLINIELKTDHFEYPGLEEKVLNEVREEGLESYILWSSFNPRSLARMRALAPESRLAVLAEKVSDCTAAADELGIRDLHPYLQDVREIAKTQRISRRYRVRAWCTRKEEALFPASAPTGDGYKSSDSGPMPLALDELASLGVSALITNNCDLYREKRTFETARRQVQAETQLLRAHCAVEKETGLLCAYHDMWATPEPIPVCAGDRIDLTADGVLYRRFFYRNEVPAALIRERGYRIDSNRTTYAGSTDPDWQSEAREMSEDGYVRIVLKKDPETALEPFRDEVRLDDLLRIRRAQKPDAPKLAAAIQTETLRLEQRLEEQTDPEDLRFLLCTDAHYAVGGAWEQTLRAIRHVCSRTEPDGLVHLGDLTDGALPREETNRYALRVLEGLGSTGLPLFVSRKSRF